MGSVAAAVLILYCAYLIYFDWTKEHFVGSAKQQVWLLLHFPLHLLLALAVEGVSWCISWRAATVKNNWLISQVDKWLTYDASNGSLVLHDYANQLEQVSFQIINDTFTTARSPAYARIAIDMNSTVHKYMGVIRNPSNWENGEVNGYNTMLDLGNIDSLSLAAIAGFYKGNLELTQDELDSDAPTNSIDANFKATFIYTFVSTGLIIIICTLMAALSKQKKSPLHWLRLGISAAIGIFLW